MRLSTSAITSLTSKIYAPRAVFERIQSELVCDFSQCFVQYQYQRTTKPY